MIGEGITEIGDRVFSEYHISSVQLPESLKTIGKSAFLQCENIREVQIPKGVEFLGDDAFGGCLALEKFTILGNVKTEGSLFGEDCPDVLEIGGELGRIGEVLCNGEEMILPKEIKFINNNPFYKQEGSLVLSSDGTQLLYQIGTADSVQIPESVTEIADYAFYRKSISQISFGKNLTAIGDYAFYRNKIKSVKFPAELKTIGAMAFYCNGLKTVKFNKSIEKIKSDAFEDNKIGSVKLYGTPNIEAGAFDSKTKIQYAGKAKMQGSFASARIGRITGTKASQVELKINKVSGADGYVVKIAQSATGKSAAVKTKKRTVVRKNFTFKTEDDDEFELKYAISAKVRPYKLVKKKKVYGKWSAKVTMRFII